MEFELLKGDLLFSNNGCSVYATNDVDLAIMEWKDEKACHLAEKLHGVVKRHALHSNFVRHFGKCELLVQRMEPLPLTVRAHSTVNQASVRFVTDDGESHARDELTGVKRARLDVMEDTALHLARSLRPYLGQAGIKEWELSLSFGICPSGECVLEVPNPLTCDLGSTDYGTLITYLS